MPSDADTAWRQAELEQWVRRVLEAERSGADVLLSGQSPLGEVLAAPSARVAVCLVDVADDVRRARLSARDPGVWDDDAVRNFNLWGEWHRGHAADPQAQPGVLTESGWSGMRWQRWNTWTREDPRWRTLRLDTTGRTVEESCAALQEWVLAERRLLRTGAHPLRRGWDVRA